MRGSLAETSVADLCRRLADAGATGTLEVEHPAGRGRLSFVDGRLAWAEPPTGDARLGDRLVHAGLLSRQHLEDALAAQRELESPPQLGTLLVERGATSRDSIRVYVQEQILDALVELTLRSEGSYHFAPGAPPGEELPADLAVGDALAAVDRRKDQWERIRAAIPDAEVVPHATGQAPTSAERLEPDDVALLEAIDGRRSVRDLAVALGYGTYETVRIVYGLHLLGLVEARPPGPRPEPSVDLDDEEFARLLEELDEEDGPSEVAAAESTGPEPMDELRAILGGVAEDRPARPEPAPTAEGQVEAGDPEEDGPAEEDEPDDAGEAESASAEPERTVPRGSRTRSGDVSEFLRELSQLAVDDEDR